ncbi:MAG: hypothetical protein LBF97_01645 [Elusimicrobiota bacterium]|jgi:hypothetical protein|nr:hypothetical protein [Elusimicrobiota bacterium]
MNENKKICEVNFLDGREPISIYKNISIKNEKNKNNAKQNKTISPQEIEYFYDCYVKHLQIQK